MGMRVKAYFDYFDGIISNLKILMDWRWG